MTTDFTELLDLDLVSRLNRFDRLVRIIVESCRKFWSWQNTSFVATKHIFSRDKHVFFATTRVCRDKNDTCDRPGPHSSGAVWESRWRSWAVRPNEPPELWSALHPQAWTYIYIYIYTDSCSKALTECNWSAGFPKIVYFQTLWLTTNKAARSVHGHYNQLFNVCGGSAAPATWPNRPPGAHGPEQRLIQTSDFRWLGTDRQRQRQTDGPEQRLIQTSDG